MSIDLRHRGCGGFFHKWATSGNRALFRCEKCRKEATALCKDAESKARERQASEQRTAEWANLPAVEPPKPIRKLTAEEALVLAAYRWWSEETRAASFLSPDVPTVREFIAFLGRERLFFDYEAGMLATYADVIKSGAE